MTISIDKCILNAVKQHHRGAGSVVDPQQTKAELLAVWRAVCEVAEDNLRSGKGLVLPKFGTFSFELSKTPDPSNGRLLRGHMHHRRRPVFLLNRQLCLELNLTGRMDEGRMCAKGSVYQQQNTALRPLNFSLIASMTGVGTETQASFNWSLIMLGITNYFRSSEDVELDFGFARLLCNSNRHVTVRFQAGLAARIAAVLPEHGTPYNRNLTAPHRPFAPTAWAEADFAVTSRETVEQTAEEARTRPRTVPRWMATTDGRSTYDVSYTRPGFAHNRTVFVRRGGPGQTQQVVRPGRGAPGRSDAGALPQLTVKEVLGHHGFYTHSLMRV